MNIRHIERADARVYPAGIDMILTSDLTSHVSLCSSVGIASDR